jgi:hypothetical protein
VTFGNPIVGEEDLIRTGIKSPNYVAGTTGWRIAQDGTADFASATVRGSISANNGAITLDASGVTVDGSDGSYVELTTVAGAAFTELSPAPRNGYTIQPAYVYGTQDQLASSPNPQLVLQSPKVTAPNNYSASYIIVQGETGSGSPGIVQIKAADGTLLFGYVDIQSLVRYIKPCGKLLLGAATRSIGTGAITAVQYTTEVRDYCGFHDNVTNPSRVTPNIPGVYRVKAATCWAANATGTRRTYIGKNGSAQSPITYSPVVTANQWTQMAETQVSCNGTTDYFEHLVFQDSGGALNVVGDTIETTTFASTLEWEYVSAQ